MRQYRDLRSLFEFTLVSYSTISDSFCVCSVAVVFKLELPVYCEQCAFGTNNTRSFTTMWRWYRLCKLLLWKKKSNWTYTEGRNSCTRILSCHHGQSSSSWRQWFVDASVHRRKYCTFKCALFYPTFLSVVALLHWQSSSAKQDFIRFYNHAQ